MHLEEDALDLYSWLSSEQVISYWEELTPAFQKHYEPPEFQNPDEFLVSVRQTGTVQEYRQEFAKRTTRVSNWPDLCLLGHLCKICTFKLLEVEAEEENAAIPEEKESEDPVEDMAEISLHAIFGKSHTTTMKVLGTLNSTEVLILIDSGSTHNFISDILIHELSLITQVVNPFGVQIGNGDIIRCIDGKKYKLQGVSSGPQKSATFQQLSLVSDIQTPTPTHLQPLITSFSSVFQEPNALPPFRSHYHSIPLIPNSSPSNIRPYRYPHAQKTEFERQVELLLASDFIQPSTSPFSSPNLLVKKKDATWRMCIDYISLNKITVVDKYPIPNIDELLVELYGSTIFSKVDLRSGYYQIRVNPPDIEKTAFRTHSGHYEFKVMPFGLTNAPSTFQAVINDLFRPYLRRFVLVFFDDILIYSKSLDDHESHLKIVLDLLLRNKFFAKESKCCFGQRSVLFLGHVVSAEGVQVDQDKVQVVTSWPIPSTVKEVRGFLGLTGCYRRFVRHYGIIAHLLTALTKKDGFKWNEEAALAFNKLKQALISTPVLRLPDFSQPFVVECDASGDGVGAILIQEDHPIAYF
ncbi:hypothetical protein E3N88_37798 [Mikania micrantha]|uniref:Reverse transcriptase domain-containing protein n=1 Tax=Mikania micrantha TaxID=192012 RepID=A0A5N6LS69_9ASTR|nr:hypothetical protein E3N88_37798 [Mikania micrantha]